MRIRRPPLPYLSSSPLLLPDPSSPLQPAKGLDEPKEGRGGGGGGGGEGLHPHGNLSTGPHGLGRAPTRRAPQDPNPSDPQPAMGGRSPSLLGPGHLPSCCIPLPNPTHVQVSKEVKQEEEMMVDSNKGSHGQVNSNKRNRCSSGAQPSGAPPAPLAGESFVPPKKRRGGYDAAGAGDVGDGCSEESEKKAKPKARAAADNNCTGASGDNSSSGGSSRKFDGGAAKGERDGGADGSGSNGAGKKRRSPAVLMEGSRCSRVNGRGWRCCQQTLVGYSLCEHHLGKGRLRSMSSVRGQLGTNDKPKRTTPEEGDRSSTSVLPSHKPRVLQCTAGAADHGAENGIETKEEEDQKPPRKKKKIGMVKARSISSLLDDTNRPAAPPVHPPRQPATPPLNGSSTEA